MCACKSTRIFSLLWKSNRIVAVDCVHTDFKRRCSSTFFLFICCARNWPWIMWPGPTQFNASSISFYSASALNTLSPFDELPVKHKRYQITAERVAFQTIWNVHSNYNKMVAFICYRVAEAFCLFSFFFIWVSSNHHIAILHIPHSRRVHWNHCRRMCKIR